MAACDVRIICDSLRRLIGEAESDLARLREQQNATHAQIRAAYKTVQASLALIGRLEAIDAGTGHKEEAGTAVHAPAQKKAGDHRLN